MSALHPLRATLCSLSLISSLAACGGVDNNDSDGGNTTDTTLAQWLDCSSFGGDLRLTNEVDDGVDYIVDCVANVGGDLVIEPGVVIQFAPEAGLRVGGGSISAVGSAEAPIVLTGEVKEKGAWRGVYIESDNVKNKLEHVTLEYAGGEAFNSNGDKGSIVLYAGGTLSLKNSTIKESAHFGLNNNYAASLTFEENTITGSELAPITIQAQLLHELDAASQLTGNGRDRVETNDAAVSVGEVTWEALSVPYFVGASLWIKGSSVVTIAPGATFLFAPNGGLSIQGSSALSAQGTSEAPITLKGEVEEKGSWRGVYVDTNDPRNSFDHVELMHAGGGAFNSNGHLGALILAPDSKASLKNSTIAQSAAFGLNGHSSVSGLTFEKNTITECDREPVVVPAALLHEIDVESDLTGNAKDYVTVGESKVSGVTATWESLSVPYYMRSGGVLNVAGGSVITIGAGTEFRFGADAGLSVSGALIAAGNEAARVQLLGEVEVAESWRGVYFGSDNVLNKLTHTTIKHAGSSEFNSNGDKGGVIVYGDARLEVEDLAVEESGACGVNVTSRSGTLLVDGGPVGSAASAVNVCLPD